MSWSFAYSKRAGASHEGQPCDDAFVCELVGDLFVAAVSDGAGSAQNSGIGAELTCHLFRVNAAEIFDGSVHAECLIGEIQDAVRSMAESKNVSPLAYSATLVGVIAGPEDTLVVQIGDGACVIETADGLEVGIWPEESECLNETFFVTAADALHHLRIRRIQSPAKKVAIFSDGLQHMVLDAKDKVPHGPFFEAAFKTLPETEGPDPRAQQWIEKMLASEMVTKRTDDDTTLVIARRLEC